MQRFFAGAISPFSSVLGATRGFASAVLDLKERQYAGHPSLTKLGIKNQNVLRNLSVPELYEMGLTEGKPVDNDTRPSCLSDAGALIAYSGKKTGRVPKEKRIVYSPESKDIWWGDVNMKLEEKSFMMNRTRAVDYLNSAKQLYVVDGYGGWSPEHRIRMRVISTRAYHALFMRNMMIRPNREELEKDFANGAEYTMLNAGEFPADPAVPGLTANSSVALHFGRKEMVILGTQYAGEMKKGLFTIAHYIMPNKGMVSLHASCNEGPKGDTTLLFGLSGTGKTTLSADPNRRLLGDDEHVWSDEGVFNIEGGCYAKCINLSKEKEPQIFNAIRFGSVLENVIIDPHTRAPDYNSDKITENTRCCYPLEFIDNCKMPAVGGHPKNIIFLTCDAFGVLPPVSRLTPAQAMYHFISGYTAKVAGTEVGVLTPQATFSSCFGAAFLVHHPTKYATMLADMMKKHNAQAWLVNTGWTGGSYGVGKRMSLPYTRAIIDGIHSGELLKAPCKKLPVFGLDVPVQYSKVPTNVLWAPSSWKDEKAYHTTLSKLGGMFRKNFKTFEDKATREVIEAGPMEN